MARFLVSLCLTASLGACGGGGPDGPDGPDGPGGGARAADVESLAEEAVERYVGSDEPAVLDDASAGQWFEQILFGDYRTTNEDRLEPVSSPFVLSRVASPLPEVGNGFKRGLWGGSMHLMMIADPVMSCGPDGTRTRHTLKPLDETGLELMWRMERCVSLTHLHRNDGWSLADPSPRMQQLDGDVYLRVRYENPPNEAPRGTVTLGYDDVEVVDGERTVTVHGMQTRSFGYGCGKEPDTITTLLVTDDRGDDMLVENLRTGLTLPSDGGPSYCRESRLEVDAYNRFDGTIRHSRLGRVSIATPEAIAYPDSTGQGRLAGSYLLERVNAATADRVVTGRMVLSNERGTAATWTSYVDVGMARYPGIKSPDDIGFAGRVEIALSSLGATEPRTWTSSWPGFVNGELADLRDRDADGMPDGWERVHGLDPDADDTMTDADTDGIRAIDEYRASLDPGNPADRGIVGDHAVGTGRPSRLQAQGRGFLVRAFFHMSYFSKVIRPDTIGIDVQLSGDGAFLVGGLPRGCPPAGARDTSVSCRGVDPTTSFTLTVWSPTPTGFSVRAKLVVPAYDRNAANDVAEAFFDPSPEEVRSTFGNMTIRADERVAGNAGARVASAIVSGPSNGSSTSGTVYVEPSPGVLLDALELVVDGHDVPIRTCSVVVPASCALEAGPGTGDLVIEIRYRLEEGIDEGTIGWRLVPDGGDADLDDNVALTDVRRVGRTSTLQTIVDAADEGVTVELPPGEWMGPIDLGGRTLVLAGASGEPGTTLVTDDRAVYAIRSPGDASVIRSLSFRTAGNAIDLGEAADLFVTDSDFAPSDLAFGGVTALVEGRGSFRFVDNRVSGFGTTAGNHCSHVLVLGGRYADVRGNRFLDNDCEALLSVVRAPHLLGSSLTPQDVSIANNTFLRNSALLEFEFALHADTAIVNNIVVDTADLFAGVHEDRFAIASTATLRIGGNLLHDTDGTELATPTLSAVRRGFVNHEPRDLYADPQFADAPGGDVRLSASSPAIDRVADAVAFERAVPEHPHAGLDAAVIGTPLDGDGDGVSGRDAGALEFAP